MSQDSDLGRYALQPFGYEVGSGTAVNGSAGCEDHLIDARGLHSGL